jgi:hypothetical protein
MRAEFLRTDSERGTAECMEEKRRDCRNEEIKINRNRRKSIFLGVF